MSLKCPVCERTFSQRSAYTQHVQKCIKKVDVENEDVEMDTKSDQYSDDENNIEVIILFWVVSYKALRSKKNSA